MFAQHVGQEISWLYYVIIRVWLTFCTDDHQSCTSISLKSSVAMSPALQLHWVTLGWLNMWLIVTHFALNDIAERPDIAEISLTTAGVLGPIDWIRAPLVQKRFLFKEAIVPRFSLSLLSLSFLVELQALTFHGGILGNWERILLSTIRLLVLRNKNQDLLYKTCCNFDVFCHLEAHGQWA